MRIDAISIRAGYFLSSFLIDEMLQVSDKDAFLTTRRLARREAMLAGGSSGAALWGVCQAAAELPASARVVTILPDSGSRYLSTIYNDEWMREHGFLESEGERL